MATSNARSDSARISRHGHMCVCTPAKAQAQLNAQPTSGKRVARLCSDGMTRIWDAAGHMVKAFDAQAVVLEMAALPNPSFYRAR